MLAALVLASLVFVPVAAPGTATAEPRSGLPDYPVTVCSSLAVSTTRPLPGEKIQVTGVDFRADRVVHLVLDTGRTLGAARTDRDGSFTASVGLPPDLHGHHLIRAVGGAVRLRSCPVDPVLRFDVAGDAAHRRASPAGSSVGDPGSSGSSTIGDLSVTGTNVLGLLALALLLVVAGAALHTARRGRLDDPRR